MLLIKDPFQIGFSTDHPNGAPFTTYPMAFKWLMDRKSRDEMLKNSVHKKASTASTLSDLDRELSLYELAIVTRAGTSKILGMKDRGHLSVGALGDVAIYKLDPNNYTGNDIEKAFSSTAYTIKEGTIVVKDGEITAAPMGTLLRAEGKLKESIMEEMLDDVRHSWRDHYSINFNNYAVQDAYAPKEKVFTGN